MVTCFRTRPNEPALHSTKAVVIPTLAAALLLGVGGCAGLLQGELAFTVEDAFLVLCDDANGDPQALGFVNSNRWCNPSPGWSESMG